MINITYSVSSIDPVEPISGDYSVTIEYVLSYDGVADFTSEVETTINSALLYQNVTPDMEPEDRTAQIKRNFELSERPAFEAYARRAKEAKAQLGLIDDLPSLTSGVVALSSAFLVGIVSFDVESLDASI